ncbi:hypothetical protein [Psittacicella hinzii]|uniref:Lipoprotein n=1 Tax=Psittacicella hinzii TaxID=2028575 RepID=A0A3A1YNI5_9GAMM|nr:hypothetical protein [Psittacicella hinzii]RIY39722.1 hypothetical protein CKF58_01880 [Psittacicella hinzii]
MTSKLLTRVAQALCVVGAFALAACDKNSAPETAANNAPAAEQTATTKDVAASLDDVTIKQGLEALSQTLSNPANSEQLRKINHALVGTSDERLAFINKYMQDNKDIYPDYALVYQANGAYVKQKNEAYTDEIDISDEAVKDFLAYSFVNNYELIAKDFKYFSGLNVAEYYYSLYGVPLALNLYPDDFPNRLLDDAGQASLYEFLATPGLKEELPKQILLECQTYGNYQLVTTGLTGQMLDLANKYNAQALGFCQNIEKAAKDLAEKEKAEENK